MSTVILGFWINGYAKRKIINKTVQEPKLNSSSDSFVHKIFFCEFMNRLKKVNFLKIVFVKIVSILILKTHQNSFFHFLDPLNNFYFLASSFKSPSIILIPIKKRWNSLLLKRDIFMESLLFFVGAGLHNKVKGPFHLSTCPHVSLFKLLRQEKNK